jgi:hypothetical protein
MPRRRAAVLGLALVGVVLVGALGFAHARSQSFSSTERAQVRRAVVTLLEADVAIGRLPDDVAVRQVAVASGRGQRRAALERIWVSEEVESNSKDWEQGLDSVADDASYDPYVDNRLVVAEWEGARKSSDGVEVTFTGHMEFRGTRSHGRWTEAPLTRYRVELDRAPGRLGWLLAEDDEEYLEAP